jgi:hypothetical protein
MFVTAIIALVFAALSIGIALFMTEVAPQWLAVLSSPSSTSPPSCRPSYLVCGGSSSR